MTRRAALPSDVTGELRDRAEQVLERAEDIRERAPEVAEELRPVVRRTEIRALSLFRTFVNLILMLPRIVVRTLGVLADSIDEVVDKSSRLAERGRQAVDAIPPAQATVRRRRLRTTLWFGAGFGAGFLMGWLVAQRQADEFVDETDELDPGFDPSRSDDGPVRPAAVPD